MRPILIETLEIAQTQIFSVEFGQKWPIVVQIIIIIIIIIRTHLAGGVAVNAAGDEG